MAVVNTTIGSDVSRDYSTVDAWEAANGGGDGAGNDDCTGECYNDSAFTMTATSTVIDFLALSITLTAASGEEHDGTAGTGVRLYQTGVPKNITFTAKTQHNITVSWLEFSANGIAYNFLTEFSPGASDNYNIHHLLIHGDPTETSAAFKMNLCNCRGWDEANASYIHNLFVYETHCGRTDAGYGVNSYYDGIHYFNITIHNCQSEGGSYYTGLNQISSDRASQQFRNICSTDCDTDFIDAGILDDATISNILTSDASAHGTDPLINKASADQYVSNVEGSIDLHLKAGADAFEAGYTVTLTPDQIELDIDGEDRTGETWDIGADLLVSAGGGGSIFDSSIFSTQVFDGAVVQ